MEMFLELRMKARSREHHTPTQSHCVNIAKGQITYSPNEHELTVPSKVRISNQAAGLSASFRSQKRESVFLTFRDKRLAEEIVNVTHEARGMA